VVINIQEVAQLVEAAVLLRLGQGLRATGAAELSRRPLLTLVKRIRFLLHEKY
jgi:hypothetical protein